MADEFLSDFSFDPNYPESPPNYVSGERERLKLILIGSAEGIREMIHKMHQRDLAEVGSWSRLLPVPNSDEVMSVLMLYRRRGE